MLNLRLQSGNAAMLVRSYAVTPDGATVDLYTLGSETGLRVQVTTYGGTIVGIEVPDRKVFATMSSSRSRRSRNTWSKTPTWAP